jgi:hypothetical protein
LQRQPYAVTGRSVQGTTVQKHLIETEVENSAQKLNKNKPVPTESSAGGWSDPLVALAYSNRLSRTLGRASGLGRGVSVIMTRMGCHSRPHRASTGMPVLANWAAGSVRTE